jgi:hypothetical protein
LDFRPSTSAQASPVFLGLAVLLVLAACGRTSPLIAMAGPCIHDSECPAGLVCLDGVCQAEGGPDAGPEAPLPLKRFGEPCDSGAECQSGFCLPGPAGSFCTVRCAQACPVGYDCKLAPDPAGTGAPLGLCAVAQSTLCQPCATDLACGASGADRCLALGASHACGRDCTFAPCPAGYACGGADGGTPGQCVPVTGGCDCASDTLGLTRGCSATSGYGSCPGNQVCQPGGWGACSAPAPGPEVCNGLDDDCNGWVDDGLAPRPCTVTNQYGACAGTETCRGADGWVCDARTPAAEVCNYADDNCDGRTDEGFVDAQGRYVTAEHCGGCGNDCRALVPHVATAACVLDAAGAPACRALTCAPGFFPYADGAICLTLPANLCAPCTADADCVGPGSRCLDLGGGERGCGRACGPGSPYGAACPAGYACTAGQCTPAPGTCACTAATAGAMRACTVQTCGGFQTCGAGGWSACDVASYHPEVCDAIDNDCDGRIDEGFLDPTTGKYTRDDNCGFCNNDCGKYWSPAVQHATGTCDPRPALPVCRMQCLAGWVDVNGEAADGCECHRLADDDPPDEGPYPTPGQPAVDANCDGVDGVIAKALFVAAGAAAGGDGTIGHPYRTIAEALAAFPGAGRQYILVAEGTYRENVTLAAGVQLFGGYSGDFRARDVVLHTSIIQGQLPAGPMSGPRGAVHAEGIAQASPRTVLSGFTILGADVTEATPPDEDGVTTIAVYVKDCGPGLTLSDNEIVAGRGGKGGRGSTGTRGYGRQSAADLDGAPGTGGGRMAAPCQDLSRAGGAGGRNQQCGNLDATPGAGVVCPAFDWTPPKIGTQQAYQAPVGNEGAGGYDLSFDDQSGTSCSHMTQGTAPGTLSNHNGKDGAAGADGADGAGGAGCAGAWGSVVAGQWVPGSAAAGGAPGQNGAAGGGGGAGGGVAAFLTGCGAAGCCPSFEYGSTGGGGGAGACGGGGGRAGRAGGASIAVLVVFSATPAAGQTPAITANRIQRNFGGDGGEGGFGGLGGLGGDGGYGGTAATWSGSNGGKGGDGGNGGAGGGGGGGCGGASYGLLAFNAGAADWAAPNAFVTDDAAPTGGRGGRGGSATNTAGYGAPGAAGGARNVLALAPCAAGCPAATRCDANGVCVPQ